MFELVWLSINRCKHCYGVELAVRCVKRTLSTDSRVLRVTGVYMGENPVCGVQPGYTLPPPVGLSQGPPADARQLPPVGFPSPSGYPEQVPIGFVRPPAAGYPGQCPAGYPPQPGYPGGQCGGEG